MSETHDTLLTEIRERYAAAEAAWSKIREEGRKDIRFVAGDPWELKDRQARDEAGRPCLSFDEIGQYVNQSINEVRLNKRAIKVSPVGSQIGSDADRWAEARANLMRQIEYRSNAPQQAYTTMFENAVQRGTGWLRVVPRYESDESFDQELRIVEIPNPDLVLPDPDHQMADGSDLEYLFFHEWYSEAEFGRKFKQAQQKDFRSLSTDVAPGWIKGDKVCVAEYWTKKTRERELLLVQGQQGPQAVFADQVKGQKVAVLKRRAVQASYVCQYLTNGVEILSEKVEWPGKDIPFVPCYGKVLFVDNGGAVERQIISLVRLARDPVMFYAYLRSCEAEIIGAVPRNSWIGYEGQFRGKEGDWQKANHEPVAFLEARPTVEGLPSGTVLPLPQRQPWDPPLQNMEMVAEATRRAIQAAMGTSPLPTSAQRRNEKSGKALQQIEESGQKGSFHFTDHYEASIRRTGELLNDLIPHYYDAARDLTVRKPDDTTQQLRVNDPNAIDPETQQPAPVMLTQGQFDVTIGTGPSFDSEREAASEFADLLMQTPFAQLVADLAVKMKNLGPIGDQMADRLTPAPFRKPKDGQIDATAMQQQLAEAQQAIEALTKELDERVKQIETEEVKGKVQIQIAEMTNAARIRIAEIAASVKGYQVEAEHAAQHEAQALGHEFDAEEAEAGRQHDAVMADMGHQQALEQGEQGHQQAIEQSAMQAALQPPAAEARA